MVAQAARRTNNNGWAGTKRAAFFARIHSAHTGCNAQAGLFIEPAEFAADLQGQFACRRDDERQWAFGQRCPANLSEQFGRKCQSKRDRFARAGLRRNDQVASRGIGCDGSGLNRGGCRIAALGQSLAQDRW